MIRNPNNCPVVQNPDDLANAIASLKKYIVENEDGSTVLGPMSEQHYLLAIAALDTALAHMKLADYWQARKD
jgi:hypothetical protein